MDILLLFIKFNYFKLNFYFYDYYFNFWASAARTFFWLSICAISADLAWTCVWISTNLIYTSLSYLCLTETVSSIFVFCEVTFASSLVILARFDSALLTSSVNLTLVTSNSLIAPCYLSLASFCNFCSFYLISAWSWTACCCFSCSNFTFIWFILCSRDIIIAALSDNYLVFLEIYCSSWERTFFSMFAVSSCFHLVLYFCNLSI